MREWWRLRRDNYNVSEWDREQNRKGIPPVAAQTRSTIDGNISDLFFNHDIEDCKTHDHDGKFAGWNMPALRVKADEFLYALRQLGVSIPTVDDLIADFLARV